MGRAKGRVQQFGHQPSFQGKKKPWLDREEKVVIHLGSERQSLRSVSFKEESCTTITPKALEKTGLV